MSSMRGQTPFVSMLLSVLVALFLTTLPIPKEWQWVQPQWLLLVAIYWGLILPHRFGVVSAWIVGLIVDCVSGELIGIHALAMAVIAQLVYLLHIRIRTFPAWQRAAVVFIFVGLYQTLLRIIFYLLNYPAADGLLYYLSSVSSVLVWPLLVWILSPAINRRGYN